MDDLDIIQKDKIMALSDQVGSEILPVILAIFKQELEGYIEQLSEDSVDENHDRLGRICHAIKGSAPSFGAMLLAEKASQIDALYKQAAWVELDKKRIELIPLIKITLEKLEQLKS